MRWLADRFLTFDPRSLGLFRLLFGLALLGDLFYRWRWVEAFYSNDGVLPNHNHLFLLMDQGQTWSIFHSFSSIEEAHCGMMLTFGIYLCFTLGYKTRAMHVASLLCLVSLCGRNVLFDNVGQSVALVLCAMTALLPLGVRYSLDEFSRSMAAFDEKDAAALNDRSHPSRPGGSATLAALGVLVLLAIIYYGAALQQRGPTWKDGSALYYALHVDRWTSGLGAALRSQSAVLGVWTRLLWAVQLVIVPLALVPVARHITRPIAIGAMLFHALTFCLLFEMGLYGWSLLAAAALLVPGELWDKHASPTRPIDLYYDADCGVCLWCARWLKRLDSRGNVTFHDNAGPLPEGVTEELTQRSMVVVDAQGAVTVDAAALSEVCLAVRPLWLVGWLVRVPGIRELTRKLYNGFATRRFDVSAQLGMGVCGIPNDDERADPDAEDAAGYRTQPSEPAAIARDVSPAGKLWRALGFALGGVVTLLIVLTTLAQSERLGELPVALGLSRSKLLVDMATWSRVTAPWGVWAPDPPLSNDALVVEAETRGGWRVDVLTGWEPDMNLATPKRHRRGVLWSAYTARIADDEYTTFRKELRQYLTRGGATVDTAVTENYVQKLSVYWISVPTPAPGQPPIGEPSRREIFTQKGRLGSPRSDAQQEPKPGDRPNLPDVNRLPPFFPKKPE